MLTICRDTITDSLSHTLAQRVGRAIGIKLTDEQRIALLLISSTLPDGASLRDLVDGGSVDAAVNANIGSDTVGHFEQIRLRLQRATITRLELPLFDLFVSDRRILGHTFDVPQTHIETHCPQCRTPVRRPATSWREVKMRPYRCSHDHVFGMKGASFIRLKK